jgi:selenium metabolism protein YedF
MPESIAPEYFSCDTDAPLVTSGPTVFVIAADTMGKGSDELGAVLMKAFIHVAIELETVPDVMIFYNAGVKLAAEGSDFLNDLKELEKKGVKMLVCGTCVNYYNLTGKIAAGVVSNMYDIAGALSRAGRIVKP